MSIFGKNEEVRQGATGNWYTMAIIDGLIPIKPNIKTKARAYLSANQLNLVSGSWTKLLLNSEDYDVGSDFDAVTNNRFDVLVTGYYLIETGIGFLNLIANKIYGASIYKNGTSIKKVIISTAVTTGHTIQLGDMPYLTATDYIELYAYSLAGVNTVGINAAKDYTHLTIHLLSV